MGLEFSYFQVLHKYINNNEIIEQKPDGTITTSRSNPYVSGAIITSITMIMLMYMERGSGTISKIINKTCQCDLKQV